MLLMLQLQLQQQPAQSLQLPPQLSLLLLQRL
jgi:hypothetical protein